MAAAMTSPSAANATAEGTTKKAMRWSAASMRVRSALKPAVPAASADIAGSSAAETDMPNRLTGSV
jgi:hypothetical protein